MKRMKNSWWNEVQLFFTVSSDRNQILISIVQLTSFMMLFYFKMYSFFFFVLPFDSFSLKTATICPFHVYIINLISYKMHLKISHNNWMTPQFSLLIWLNTIHSDFETRSRNNGSCAKLCFWRLHRCKLYIGPIEPTVWSHMVHRWTEGKWNIYTEKTISTRKEYFRRKKSLLKFHEWWWRLRQIDTSLTKLSRCCTQHSNELMISTVLIGQSRSLIGFFSPLPFTPNNTLINCQVIPVKSTWITTTLYRFSH